MQERGQITILLVDPTAAVLDRHANMLHEMGYFNHLQAENGSEALAMVNNFDPDLIIARQNTPEINGLSLLRLVRQQDTPDTETVFVLYGENINTRLLAQAGRSGVNAVILMPCDDDSFKARLSEALYPPKDPEDEKAEELYDLSLKQISRGEFDQALVTCNDILEIHANAEVYFNMGYIKSVKGELTEALACFRRATMINSHHAKAYEQMGLIYQKLGRNEEARASLEKAAGIHMERRQDTEAEEIFNAVLTLRPDTINVYNSLGIIYRRQGRLDEAVKAYEKAVRVHPDDEYIYFNAARAYLDLGNPAMAQRFLRHAIRINSEFTEAADLLRATELGLKIKV